jgi:hypothetical protein
VSLAKKPELFSESPLPPPAANALFVREYDESRRFSGCLLSVLGVVLGLVFVGLLMAIGRKAWGASFVSWILCWLLGMLVYRLWLGFSSDSMHWIAVEPSGVRWVTYKMGPTGGLLRNVYVCSAAEIVSLELHDPASTGARSYLVTTREHVMVPAHLVPTKAQLEAFAAAVKAIAPHAKIQRQYK